MENLSQQIWYGISILKKNIRFESAVILQSRIFNPSGP